MKQTFVFLAIFAVLSIACAEAQTSPQAEVEITFTFTRQTGSASNQFAVWIEDSQGKYIKTLYAARYTATGGFKRRSSSIPVWVKQSDIANMAKADVDALTGATPRTGSLVYTWDGTDSKGAVVGAGEYVVYLEGTLRWENLVLYSAAVRLGHGAAPSHVDVKYTPAFAISERSMISDVKVRTLR
jgi:hypothetical protein